MISCNNLAYDPSTFDGNETFFFNNIVYCSVVFANGTQNTKFINFILT
jgi:hypothetical protein